VTTRQAEILASASLATLVRRVPVRVVDVSRAGCRLEASLWLRAGTIGQLRLSLRGGVHEDDVRISRCQMRAGAGRTYLLGAELLGTRRLYGRSIRLAISNLIAAGEALEHPRSNDASDSLPNREDEQQAKGVSRAPPLVAGKGS
jgi:hypothetical protein